MGLRWAAGASQASIARHFECGSSQVRRMLCPTWKPAAPRAAPRKWTADDRRGMRAMRASGSTYFEVSEAYDCDPRQVGRLVK